MIYIYMCFIMIPLQLQICIRNFDRISTCSHVCAYFYNLSILWMKVIRESTTTRSKVYAFTFSKCTAVCAAPLACVCAIHEEIVHFHLFHSPLHYRRDKISHTRCSLFWVNIQVIQRFEKVNIVIHTYNLKCIQISGILQRFCKNNYKIWSFSFIWDLFILYEVQTSDEYLVWRIISLSLQFRQHCTHTLYNEIVSVKYNLFTLVWIILAIVRFIM